VSLPLILTIGEAARYSGLHRDFISAALHRGDLPFREIEGRKFVLPGPLIAWLDSQGLRMLGAWAEPERRPI
jgi:excisionase family DNA binding protein